MPLTPWQPHAPPPNAKQPSTAAVKAPSQFYNPARSVLSGALRGNYYLARSMPDGARPPRMMRFPRRYVFMRLSVCIVALVLQAMVERGRSRRQVTPFNKVNGDISLDSIYTADGKPLGTVVIGLFGETVPRTVKNFITFASKGYAGFRYEGTPIHRVIKKFMIQ
ncbi:peptidyl-prolyl cis-trans isomerase B-like, partial [Penaeus japonicus]|uniref:peptidyl-prolyl cis-trans isomerase B-like n=1 Tax=Penaeus japonicus TaxID=27405 RepID=UPI001C70FD50